MNQLISEHATDRIDSRLRGMLTAIDMNKINRAVRANPNERKIYFVVKRFPKTVRLDEIGYTGGNGTGIRGDAIIAVIRDGVLVTVMLGHSNDRRYFSDGIMLH